MKITTSESLLKFTGILWMLLLSVTLFSQKTYELDLTNVEQPEIRNDLSAFSGKNPKGETLGVNNRYFTKNGKPWFPIMGEFHYTRYPEQYWEEELVKMKSGGLDIIATYVFWNAHETEPGQWDWSGNKDLRHFIELCQKHGLYVWLRIGPWSHGEQLYGGHPVWIKKMRGKRSNNPKYLAEVKKLFEQIGQQTRGEYFKDGGSIIGVQLENEYASGDIDHVGTLKELALAAGITPVYWSVTGNTVFHDDRFEVIPLQGAYPYRGWEKGGGEATKDFLYGNDQWIMTNAVGKVYYDLSKYPKGLCEQGCGSQMTYKNRFVVKPEVVEAHLQNQIGRGMNLIGYYMFQGGTQMPGLKEPGYPESYDFQAPISEFGLLRPSYRYLKILHLFIRDFGEELAPMTVAVPEHAVTDERDTTNLRYVARISDNHGFVFLNNTQVRIPMPDKVFRLKLKLRDETLLIPRNPVTLKGDKNAIFPFNLDLNGILMKYATAQPLARFDHNGKLFLFLYAVEGTDVEIAMDRSTVKSLEIFDWKKEEDEDKIYLTPGKNRYIHMTSISGKESYIILLSRKEAENSWRTKINGRETFVLTTADLMVWQPMIELRQLQKSRFELHAFPPFSSVSSKEDLPVTEIAEDFFKGYVLKQNHQTADLNIEEKEKEIATVDLPEKLPGEMSDLFLEIRYLGSEIRAYCGDSLLTDDLFNGMPWYFGTKRFIDKKCKTITFKVFPWKRKITGVDDKLVQEARSKGPLLQSIKTLPQYRVILNVK
jgi:hypothetical protein